MPACALTTPSRPECRTQTPLPTTNDPRRGQLSAPVTLAGPQPAVLAATSTASGGDGGGTSGTFTATSLSPAGTWSAGGNNGAFTYSYAIAVPPSQSDARPDVGLSYDSSSVDGRTASTQSQSSWLGDGWSTTANFIEQSFVTCSDSPEGSPAPVATADRCYAGPVLTMSLNGSSTALIWDAAKSVWKPKSDNGSVVSRVTGSNNGTGTYNTDYWVVIDRAGTKYQFGRNQLPGWSSGKPVTNSVDSTPVYAAHAGDPCYNATFSASVCTMAHRWNLDYVSDLDGNAMALYYKQDTNNYGSYNGATKRSYVRDSYVDHIDYGFADGNAYGTAPNRVTFGVSPRCVVAGCSPLSASTKANWPDVPFDLVCDAATCTSTSPAFFSTVRLTSIATQQWSTTTNQYENVDSFALTQTMPPTGDGLSSTLGCPRSRAPDRIFPVVDPRRRSRCRR